MNGLFDKLKRLFAGEPQAEDEQSSKTLDLDAVDSSAFAGKVALDDSSLARLMSLIEQTKEGEYSCEETLDLLDEYAELAASNQDAAAIMPLVKGHLEHCVDCTERYEALLKILEA